MSLCCDLGHCSKLGSECSFFVNQAPNAVFLLQNDPMQFRKCMEALEVFQLQGGSGVFESDEEEEDCECGGAFSAMGSIMNQHLGTNMYCFPDLCCNFVFWN